MPCYHPLRGYRSKTVNTSGKRSIVFNVNDGYKDLPIDLPCGQCIGCRLERSRQWAIRCVHESQLYEDNCFITLTYSDPHLPHGHSLKVSDYQNFMKRLRFHFSPRRIRFFQCGEYGEKTKRPHYHACIFNLDFSDKYYWKTVNGHKYYRSPTLEKLWPFGQSMIGDVTFESAAYVARYITKKITGDQAEDHYSHVNLKTGEIVDRKPEYVTMSRRPGIGKDWLKKYEKDVFPFDEVVIRGIPMKPPKFYSSQFEISDPVAHAAVKGRRMAKAEDRASDNTHDRLAVKEEIQYCKLDQLKRGYENGST